MNGPKRKVSREEMVDIVGRVDASELRKWPFIDEISKPVNSLLCRAAGKVG